MTVAAVTTANAAEACQITAYGALAVLSNSSATGSLSVYWIENRTASTISYTTTAAAHLTIFYDRVNSSLDLSTVALSVNSLYDDPVFVDDDTYNDTKATLVIFPKTIGDLEGIYNKYNE